MAQTKKRRRRKHRGTQAGSVVERRSRPATAPKTKEERRIAARQARAQRFARPPTWRGALNRAAIAAIVFGLLMVLILDRPVVSALLLAGFMLLIYVPMSYYTDRFVYNRRMAKASGGGSVK